MEVTMQSPMSPMTVDNPSDTTSDVSLPDVDLKGSTPVHIEICVNKDSRLRNKEIEHLFREYWKRFNRYSPGKRKDLPPSVSKHIEYIQICMKKKSVPMKDAKCHLHIFRNSQEGMIEEIDDETSSDHVHVANTYPLPNERFDGLFESLIFEDNIKDRLLNYMKTVSVYGKAGIDKNIITWNGVILLHGPPGTGKTSLSKALAHKLSIRLIDQFPHSSLIEINAHSLFSKWFSESGKIVQKLFKYIMGLIEYQDSLIFVLIDEVESLATARKSAINGAEPSDSIRAVNALLTQIDQLRRYPNVLVLATSNISESIDLAFIDRADLKQYIGNPMEKARYFILRSCIKELLNKKILFIAAESQDNDNEYLLCYDKIKELHIEQNISPIPSKCAPNHRQKCAETLFQIVESLDGFSGRSLRKLPFITSVHFIQSATTSLMHFLECLEDMVEIEKKERDKLNQDVTMTKK